MARAGDYVRAAAAAYVVFWISGGNGSAAWKAAAATFASSLYGAARQRSAQQAAKNAYNASQHDRQQMIRSGIAPRQIILGRDKISGPIVYAASTGAQSQYLHLVIPLAGHPIDAIEEVFFNDVNLPDPDSGGFIQSGAFYKGTKPDSAIYTTNFISPAGAAVVVVLPRSPIATIVSVSYSAYAVGSPLRTSVNVDSANWSLSGQNLTINAGQPNGYYSINYLVTLGGKALVRIQKYLGTQTVADAALISETAGQWTSAHIGYGVPYLYVRLEYDDEVFGQIGLPNISAVCRGALPYDPRSNLSGCGDLSGAVVGTPGTMPTGTSAGPQAGIASSVVGFGTDSVTGFSYVDLNFSGTAGITSLQENRIRLAATPNGPPASVGQTWTARALVQILSQTTAHSQVVLRSNVYTSLSTFITQAVTADLGFTVGAPAKKAELTCTIFTATATNIGFQLCFGIVSGLTYNTTFRVMLPQLWQGTVGDASDPSGWSDNAALLSAWWLRQPIIGARAKWGEVVTNELVAEANVCDEAIELAAPGGATQPRYTANGSLSTDGALRDNLEAVLSAMAGNAAWIQGRWLLRSGSFETPELTIDESSLAQGDISAFAQIPRRDLFNSVSGVFIDGANSYVQKQLAPITSPSYVADDGGVLLEKTDLEFPMVREGIRAQRMAKIMLQGIRQAMSVELTCNLRAYSAIPGKTVYLSIAQWGISAKTMLVTERTFIAAEKRIKLVMVETSPELYAWDYGLIIPITTSPNSTLPGVSTRPPGPTLSAPVVFTAATATFGQFMAYATLTWAAASNVNVLAGGRVLIQFKRDSAVDWTDGGVLPGDSTTATVGPLDAGALSLIRAAFQDNTGRVSDWSTVVASALGVSGDGVPPAIIEADCYKYTSGGVLHTCNITFNTDGSITGDGLAAGFYWFSPVGGSPGASLYIKTVQIGSTPSGVITSGSLGSVIALSSNRTWTFTAPITTDWIAHLRHTIYADAGGVTQLGVGDSFLEADGD